MQPDWFNFICIGWMTMAVVVHLVMFRVTAPFGRHTTTSWGPVMDNRLGWFLMELPSLAIMTWFLLTGNALNSFVWILFACWILHYTNRTLIFPLRIHHTPKPIPVVIVLSAVFFNLMNAGLNGWYLAHHANPEDYSAAWLTSPSFMIGLALFITGMIINMKADNMLIALRKPGETGYRIPRGFLFDLISSANLFGEVIEWTGFAIMAWNLPALSFAVWTYANLVPRARNHHQWYQRNFQDYPTERKIIFPLIY
ncbi:MAG: DUF1295 domain-containing protein [Bacteroidota bacterium]